MFIKMSHDNFVSYAIAFNLHFYFDKVLIQNTVKHGYNEVPGTDDFASLYSAMIPPLKNVCFCLPLKIVCFCLPSSDRLTKSFKI